MNDEVPVDPTREPDEHAIDPATLDPVVAAALAVEPAAPEDRRRHLDRAMAAFDAAMPATASPDTGRVRQLGSGRGRGGRVARPAWALGAAAALLVVAAIGVRSLTSGSNDAESRADSARTVPGPLDSTATDGAGDPNVDRHMASTSAMQPRGTAAESKSADQNTGGLAPSEAPAAVPTISGATAARLLIDLGALDSPESIAAAAASLRDSAGSTDLTALGDCAASVPTGSSVIASATVGGSPAVVVRRPTGPNGTTDLMLVTTADCATRQI